MNTKYLAGGAIMGLVIAGGVAGMVSAQTVAQATGLTEEQVIEIALTEIPGEITEIEQDNHRGKSIYEVEILGEDGNETEILITADTGEIMKVKDHKKGCDKDET